MVSGILKSSRAKKYPYKVQVVLDGRVTRLGIYTTEQEALTVYNSFIAKYATGMSTLTARDILIQTAKPLRARKPEKPRKVRKAFTWDTEEHLKLLRRAVELNKGKGVLEVAKELGITYKALVNLTRFHKVTLLTEKQLNYQKVSLQGDEIRKLLPSNTLKEISNKLGIPYTALSKYLKESGTNKPALNLGTLTCSECLNIFIKRKENQRLCSENCRLKQQIRRQLNRQKSNKLKARTVSCTKCTKVFVKTRVSAKSVCPSCKSPNPRLSCICACGRNRSPSRASCYKCLVKANNILELASKQSTCTYCGTDIILSRKGVKRPCCKAKACKTKQRTDNVRDWKSDPINRDKAKLHNHKYRTKKSPKAKALDKEFKAIVRGANNGYPKYAEFKKKLEHFGVNTCCFCKTYIEAVNDRTIEHLIPRVLGGDNSVQNLFRSCRSCNESKWDSEWREWYRSQPFYDPDRELEIENLSKTKYT